MFTGLGHNWWAVSLRGVVAVLFGITAFVWPAITLITLALLFGAYALVDGIFALVHAFASDTGFRGCWPWKALSASPRASGQWSGQV